MREVMKSPIQIKGIREGLLINLGEGSFEVLQKDLLDHIDHQMSFFQGAHLALDTGGLSIKAAELGMLRDELSGRGVALTAILSSNPVTENTARMLGLATHLPEVAPRRKETIAEVIKPSSQGAILLRKTLRSGTHLEHDGHIGLIGDVNPGAEISATGSVIIWGRLLGSVHAGSRGDASAVICALMLAPTYIHIADAILQVPERKGRLVPEMASILEDRIILAPWKP
jgi:septum site-determining protein MinC